MASPINDYSYVDSGFDSFMNRSIDGVSAFNLDSLILHLPLYARQIPYDNTQVTGQLGDILTVGNVEINGQSGQITVSDGSNTRVIIGEF